MHAMLSSIPKQCDLGMGHMYEVRIEEQNKSPPGPSALVSHSTWVRWIDWLGWSVETKQQSLHL